MHNWTSTYSVAGEEPSAAADPVLIRMLFYPNGKKREFEYDDYGCLRAIDHGDGNFWLRSTDGQGWFVFSEKMTSPPFICLYNVMLDQSTGELTYETDTMHITQLTSGEKICRKR